MTKLVIYLLLMVWYGLSALMLISAIGKPRKPLTSDIVVGAVVVIGLSAAGVSYLMWSGP